MAVELSGEKFGKRLVWHVIALAAFIFGFPVAVITGASVWADDFTFPDHADIVETMRIVTGTGLGIFAYLIFVVSFAIPSWRRMRTLGLPAYLSLIVSILFLMDMLFFLSREETKIFGYSFSSATEYPLYLLSALSMAVAMALADPPRGGERAFRRFGYAGLVLVAVIAFIFVGSVLFIAAAMGVDLIKYQVKHGQEFSQTLMWFVRSMYWFLVLSPFASLALMISLARCVMLSRRKSSPPGLR